MFVTGGVLVRLFRCAMKQGARLTGVSYEFERAAGDGSSYLGVGAEQGAADRRICDDETRVRPRSHDSLELLQHGAEISFELRIA